MWEWSFWRDRQVCVLVCVCVCVCVWPEHPSYRTNNIRDGIHSGSHPLSSVCVRDRDRLILVYSHTHTQRDRESLNDTDSSILLVPVFFYPSISARLNEHQSDRTSAKTSYNAKHTHTHTLKHTLYTWSARHHATLDAVTVGSKDAKLQYKIKCMNMELKWITIQENIMLFLML